MRLPRFFDPQELSEGATVTLSENVVQHVSRALRMRPGDQIILFNGDGFEYKTSLLTVEKRSVSAHIEEKLATQVESSLQVHIGQSLSRGERMDYAVQKSTEMGVTSITPLFSERCEVKLPPERQGKRVQHWQQIAISACEQSGRVSPPAISNPQDLKNWITTQDAEYKFVLHHHSEAPLQTLEKPVSVALLIGPEGGLTAQEVELAKENGFKPLALGPRVMRTETAPVSVLAILNYLWGDLG